MFMKNILIIIFVILIPPGKAFCINVQLDYRHPACSNSNGWIKAIPTGGAAPYSFLWSNGSAADSLINLIPGTYSVTVTDNAGDTATASAILGNTNTLIGGILYFENPVSGYSHPCPGLCNGTGYLGPSINGTPPFTLSSSNPLHVPGYFGTTQIPQLSGICTTDNNYTIQVTDASGCTGIADPPTIVLFSFDHNLTVFPACNGTNSGGVFFDFTANYGFLNIEAIDSAGAVFNTTTLNGSQINGLHPGTWQIYMVLNGTACDTAFALNIPDVACGTISGSVYADTLNDCIHNANEPYLPNRLISINPGSYILNSDSTGNFSIVLPYDTYTLNTVADLNFGSNCPPVIVSINPSNPLTTGVLLGDTVVAPLNLRTGLSGSSARPGFNYSQYILIQNTSYEASSGAVLSIKFDPIITPVNSNLPYTIINPGEIEFSIPPMNAFSNLSVSLTYSVPANPGLIGNVLTTIASVTSLLPEINLTDNSDTLHVVITGSLDPNDKSVWPNEDPQHYYFMDIEDELRYTIRFQNTGTDTAFTIVIVDSLDAMLDLSTFRMIGSSHACTWSLGAGDILTVTYNNILLPDSNTNEIESHGLFSFAVAPIEDSIVIPYIIYNTAAIYFDFNPPVITNTEFSTIDVTVGINEITAARTLLIYPNPASAEIVISMSDKSRNLSNLSLYNSMGIEVTTLQNETRTHSFIYSISNLKPGLYYLRTSDGSYSGKFVKL
jgi:uncharacterized repeat protein (TIGR01451 family)